MEGGEALMSTMIRAEVSRKNPYWIDKHRYYELKHFCLQYPLWQKALTDLTCGKSTYLIDTSRHRFASDPVAAYAQARIFYIDRMDMVERLTIEASEDLADYLFYGVTRGWSYDILKARFAIPCGKDMYYEAYRRYFWLLDHARN